MMIVALIMRPWIIFMRVCQTSCFIPAGDVLIIAHWGRITDRFTPALDITHAYSQSMGARVAADNGYNAASNKPARGWLKATWWNHIKQGIEVVKDFAYLGSHLSARTSFRSPTLDR